MALLAACCGDVCQPAGCVPHTTAHTARTTITVVASLRNTARRLAFACMRFVTASAPCRGRTRVRQPGGRLQTTQPLSKPAWTGRARPGTQPRRPAPTCRGSSPGEPSRPWVCVEPELMQLTALPAHHRHPPVPVTQHAPGGLHGQALCSCTDGQLTRQRVHQVQGGDGQERGPAGAREGGQAAPAGAQQRAGAPPSAYPPAPACLCMPDRSQDPFLNPEIYLHTGLAQPSSTCH